MADSLVIGLFHAELEGRQGVAVCCQEVRVCVGVFLACTPMRSGSVINVLDWSRNSGSRFQFIVMNTRNTVASAITNRIGHPWCPDRDPNHHAYCQTAIIIS
jgi:hypothetical protein